jgi:TolB-like protein/DNA-binding SARP family transcriptional activator
VLLRSGQSVTLTPKAFDLLLVLIENRGHLVSKDTLISRVWPNTFIEENNVAVHISILRKTLAENDSGTEYIKTSPRRGYSFVGEVREEKKNERAAAKLRSIAVLPFKVISSDSGDEYLGVGMSDAIITRLSQISEIAVKPTSAVLKFAAHEIDPVETGRELGVEAVLSGRVTKAGDQIRLTVQLVDVVDNNLLWADKLDHSFTDVFTYEDLISERVARALNLKLTGEQIDRLTKRHTENSAAYWAYLKGRYYWGKRSPEGFKKAMEYFQYASTKDAHYSLAYSGLADCHTLLNYYGSMPSKVGIANAKPAALRALEADEGLAEAHASMALVKFWYDWDWLGAEIEFERAVDLNPAYATAHQWYSWYLAAMGRLEESLTEGRLALELDPLSPAINMALGKSYLFARRFEDSIRQCKRTLDIDPNFIPARYFLAQAYEQKGMHEEAIEACRIAVELTAGFPLGRAVLAKAQALAGKTDEAESTLRTLTNLSESGETYVPAYGIALIHLGLGAKASALEWLNKAYEERFIWMTYLKVDPVFDSLRQELGFEQLQKRMNFSEQVGAEFS